MNDVAKAFYKDVVGYLDYLDGIVGEVVSEVEERRVGVFKLLSMLILLRKFEDFRLVSEECVKEVLNGRSLDDFLGGMYSVLGRYVDVGFLKVDVDRFLGCSGLVDALRMVFEHECRGKKGWVGLKFYDFKKLGSGILGSVYERFLGWLDKGSRKEMGIYYTPREIVKHMCRESLFYYLVSKLEGKVSVDLLKRFVWCGDVLGVKGYEEEIGRLLAEVRVCDPSCGTGIFLVGVLDEVVKLRWLVSGVSVYESKRHAIENSLYGIDIDGVAIEVCKLRLWFSLVEGGDVIPLQRLRFNVIQGDALIKGVVEVDGGFDIVIGNPPYGASIGSHRDYIQKYYTYFESRKNSASLFIENGFEILKPGGILAFVVPKSITFVKSWEKPRALVYKDNKLLVLIDTTKAFENVKLEEVILVSQKGKHFCSYEYKVGEYWRDRIEIMDTVKTSAADRLGILPIYVNNNKLGILERILRNSVLLSDISETKRGLPFQRKVSNSSEGIEIVRGSNVGKYVIYEPLDKVILAKEEFNSQRIKKLLRPKIISQNIVAHVMNPCDTIIIQATYDTRGLLTLDTVVNTFLTDSSYPYEYVLGIINSRLAEWYYYWFVYNRAVRTMHFDGSYLGRLPIKKLNSETESLVGQIVREVDKVLIFTQSSDYGTNREKQQEVERLRRKIDELVYRLYDVNEEEIGLAESNKL
jgi:hypothetical protein